MAIPAMAVEEPAGGWSFRNHVQSVLTKSGCNSGACHGAISGKNGFHLSLRGYDADGDYLTLTRQARGRRVVPSDPGKSLILMKPTGLLPHKGGMRFPIDSLEYRVVSGWIAAGAPPPRPEDPRIQSIEVVPPASVLKKGDTLQLLVKARFSGVGAAEGAVEDVTRWAKYAGSDSSVATVDDLGKVTVVGPGEGAITVWYLSRMFVARVSVPFENEVPADAFAKAERRNFVDDLIINKLRDLRIPPSPMAGDAEVFRRMHIDTIGVLPTPEETRKFLADSSAGKRDRLIEDLLARPEFIDYWSYRWSDLLLLSTETLPAPALWSFSTWIRNEVAAGTPWDELVRKVLTAKGSTLENGAANFFVLHPDPQGMAETASLAFLGMSINCAHCHNHPLEKWTNDQYYGMASLFARVRLKDAPGDGNRIVFCSTEGELVQPLTGRPQPPRPLDGVALSPDSTADRRLELARWLTSPENPYFSRAIVNRVWANFFGVGLVEKVDDLRLTNPASNDELLSALAKHLVESRFDLKSLMRTILQSAAYQRSSEALPGNAGDRRFYSHYYPRRLMAEVLLDALSQATGAPTQFPGYPLGYRALQLPDSNVASYFLKSFGRPNRLITCECERSAEPSMAQVLHISNGDTVNQKLAAKGNRIDRLLTEGASADRIIEEAFLAGLSRLPVEREKVELAKLIPDAADAGRRAAVEDLFWSVLSTREFLFNH